MFFVYVPLLSVFLTLAVTSSRGVYDSHVSRLRTTNTRWNGRQLNLPNISLAASNLQKIRKNHSCNRPRPSLVKVKDHHHVYDKTYVPGCTLLYKCDDQAGCCENDAMQCTAKVQEAVTVFFYVLYHNETKYNSVEPLVFTNDTECECREVNPHPRTFEQAQTYTKEPVKAFETHSNLTESDLSLTYFMPADIGSASGSATSGFYTKSAKTSTTTQAPNRDQGMDRFNLLGDERNGLKKETSKNKETSREENKESLKKENKESLKKENEEILVWKKSECTHVRCPHPFHPQKVEETPFLRCTCTCFEEHEFTKCLAIKKGLHRLSIKARRCVQQGECVEPSCEYPGPYDTIGGKCPKEEDKKIRSSHHHHYQVHPRD